MKKIKATTGHIVQWEMYFPWLHAVNVVEFWQIVSFLCQNTENCRDVFLQEWVIWNIDSRNHVKTTMEKDNKNAMY